MDSIDPETMLERLGLRSEALGPPDEWQPVTPDRHQDRHRKFWGVVTDIIEDEPGEYEDLPSWMTEDGAEALLANDN